MLSIATLQAQQQCSLIGWLNWSTSWSVHLEPWMMEKLQIVGLSYDEHQHHFTSLIVLCVNVLSLYYYDMILLMYCRITLYTWGQWWRSRSEGLQCFLFVFGQCHGWWNAKCTVSNGHLCMQSWQIWLERDVRWSASSFLLQAHIVCTPITAWLEYFNHCTFLFKAFWMLIESIFYLSSV